MRGLTIRLYTTAVTGFAVYLWVIGPSAGPRAGYILFALIAFWVMSLAPRESWGNHHAGALVQWTVVAGTTVLAAVLYLNPVE